MESSSVTQVVVVGGGIAGCWAALKLAERGVITTLVTYSNTDRGGTQGSTGRSVGAINTAPLDKADFQQMLEKLGRSQTHPSAAAALGEALADELDAIQSFAEFKPIKLGLALDTLTATELLHRIKNHLRKLGVRIIEAWVAKVVVDAQGFHGLQLCENGNAIRLYARNLVIASGGYAGLFYGALKIPNYGTLIGRYLEAGGAATNLEFVFKHGYGKADMDALTPTEELPGAEVYDDQGVHVEWLERELFSGRGTQNHLEAFRYWRRNSSRKFFIDFVHQPLYRAVIAINKALEGDCGVVLARQALDELIYPKAVSEVQRMIGSCIQADGRISFDHFCQLKPHHQADGKRHVFRVGQIAYFSMGGIAHKDFKSNVPGVYVTGEAMHDFGANRVGGLPWGLYLIAGRRIADQCVQDIAAQPILPLREFKLTPGHAHFDSKLLNEIQLRLKSDLEEISEPGFGCASLSWFRDKRREMRVNGQSLSDGYAWLLVAEAIVQSARIRQESRGCFYRNDQPQEEAAFSNYFTLSTYDLATDKISTALVTKQEVFERLNGSNNHGIRQQRLG